ncbi:MAG TPA: hypothetical protein IAD23_02450 [Candidatus Scubalenecus merdavium]|uniref:Uncharacterized protein n=1 Tax=Candidatus Scybalenecus merdavium TaxID=2840939 RepID=A0A9D1MUC2_9FIRM|nr:hypothetical protein [Candidatus Scubalenecus merdavium]
MDYLVFVEILGKKYPMVFSIGVLQKMIARIGSYEDLNKVRSNIAGVIEHLSDFTYEMIRYGEKYCDYVDAEKPENAAVDENGKWLPISVGFIETCVQGKDMEKILKTVVQCMTMNQAIETKTKESKNA